MTVYYEGNGVTLHHCDCLEVAVDADLILTDPPYGQEFRSGLNRSNAFDVMVGDDDIEGITKRLLHSLKGLKRGRHIYIFGNKIDRSRFPLATSEIVWDKDNIGSGDLSLPWGPQHEIIIFGVYEKSAVNLAKGYGRLAARVRKGSVIRCLRPNGSAVRNHPTVKPVQILREMIESSSCLGETVYDPFAGSGSTLVAAVLEGRSAVGCEIEEKYCEIAAKRIEAGE